jgi:hypothetical protein
MGAFAVEAPFGELPEPGRGLSLSQRRVHPLTRPRSRRPWTTKTRRGEPAVGFP